MSEPVHTEHNINPAADIYRIMDEAGITLANFQKSSKKQTDLINEARVTFAHKMSLYIKNRDQEMIAIGKGEIQI